MEDHIYRKMGRSGMPDRKTFEQLASLNLFGAEYAILQLIDFEDLRKLDQKLHPEDGRYKRSVEIYEKLRSDFKTNPLPLESARFERMMKILMYQEGTGTAESTAHAAATLAYLRGDGEQPAGDFYSDVGKVAMAWFNYRSEIGLSKFPDSPGKYLSDLIDIACQESDRIADQLKD